MTSNPEDKIISEFLESIGPSSSNGIRIRNAIGSYKPFFLQEEEKLATCSRQFK